MNTCPPAFLRRLSPLALVAILTAFAACAGGSGGGVAADAIETDGADGTGDTAEPDVLTATCAGQPDGAPCEDGDACTTEGSCDQGVCVGGVSVICDVGGPCRTAGCDPAIGCVYDPLADGSACDTDGDLCTVETCDGAGVCVDEAAAEDCADENDGNPCWTYVCSPDKGCIKTNFVEGVSCEDNNPCTHNDTCIENEFGQETCLGLPILVDDSNACTDDKCEDGAVIHTPIEGAICTPDDGCPGAGICDGGVCEAAGEDDCGCASDEDCPQPEDLCSGPAFCNLAADPPTCAVDASGAVVCPFLPTACLTNQCNPDTGTCEETPDDDGTACAPNDPCSPAGACDGGACLPTETCPGEEAVLALDGLDATLRQSFDDGDSWTVVGTVPIPQPATISMTRTGTNTLYVTTYFSQTFADGFGVPKGNQVVRSTNGGKDWEHVGGWGTDGGVGPAVCAHATESILYATDLSGKFRKSTDLGSSFALQGNWGVQGANTDCAVAGTGLILVIDAAWCGGDQDGGCAHTWISTDQGKTFTQGANYVEGGSGALAGLAVDAGTGNFYVTGGKNDVFRSTDSGQSWNLLGYVPTGVKTVQVLAAKSDGTLYAATATSGCAGDSCDPATKGGHFFVSKDGGATWGKSAQDWTPGGNGSGWAAMVTAIVAP